MMLDQQPRVCGHCDVNVTKTYCLIVNQLAKEFRKAKVALLLTQNMLIGLRWEG